MNQDNKLNCCKINVVENGYLVIEAYPGKAEYYQKMWVFNSLDDLGEWIKKNFVQAKLELNE